MEAAKVIGTPPPGSHQPDSARLVALPSPDEEGFFYPQPPELVPTQTIEALGKIAGTDVELECTIKGPANDRDAIDRIPLLIAGGYFGPETAYDDYSDELAGRGKWVVTWNAARRKGFWADMNLLSVQHPQILASRTALGVVRATQNAAGFKQFDGSGHSYGGQTIVTLALHRPELFRTLTLKGSVGLDKHSLLEMLPRLGGFFVKDAARPRVAKLALRPSFVKEEAEYFAANIPLTIAEMISAGSCDIRRHIKTIREHHAIPVGAIQYQEDDFFPLEAVRRDSEHLFDIFHIFRNPDVRHTGPQEDPAGSAAAQLEVLAGLQDPAAARPLAA